MAMSFEGVLLLLALIGLLYVWPAVARPGRPLAAAMAVAVTRFCCSGARPMSARLPWKSHAEWGRPSTLRFGGSPPAM